MRAKDIVFIQVYLITGACLGAKSETEINYLHNFGPLGDHSVLIKILVGIFLVIGEKLEIGLKYAFGVCSQMKVKKVNEN